MKFVSVRDLRLKAREIWHELARQKEMVITSNGRPVAILAGIEGEDVVEYLTTLRRARAMLAVHRLQERAQETGRSGITAVEIDSEIRATRQKMRKKHAGTIVRLVAGGLIQVAYDSRIITEYREVLARPKFGFEKPLVDTLLKQIQDEGIPTSASPLTIRLPDPDDEPFLELACAASAILVTGNKRYFPEAARERVQVMSPAEFIRFWRKTRRG